MADIDLAAIRARYRQYANPGGDEFAVPSGTRAAWSAADVPSLLDLVGMATQYTVCAVPEDVRDWDLFAITVERTAPGRWAVRRRSRCLGSNGSWSHESIPGERRDDWLAVHRFDLGTAMTLARHAAPKVTVNEWTAERAIAEWHREAPDG